MTPEEIAVDFVTRFEKQIKETLGVVVLDVEKAARCVIKFVRNNPVIEDYYDGFNPRVTTAIIASLYEEFVPEKVREERRRVDYITRVLKQKKSGKMPARLYDDFMSVYFSGTIDTDDLTRGPKVDFNSLALKRASGIFNR